MFFSENASHATYLEQGSLKSSLNSSIKSRSKKPVTMRSIDKVSDRLDWATTRLDGVDNLTHTIAIMNLIKSSSDAMYSLQRTNAEFIESS